MELLQAPAQAWMPPPPPMPFFSHPLSLFFGPPSDMMMDEALPLGTDDQPFSDIQFLLADDDHMTFSIREEEEPQTDFFFFFFPIPVGPRLRGSDSSLPPCQTCSDDITSLCSHARDPFDDDDIIGISFANQMCLMDHRDALSQPCLNTLNDEDNLVSACHGDITSYCSDIIPGNSRVHECLMEHQSELSSTCGEQVNRAALEMSRFEDMEKDGIPFEEMQDLAMEDRSISNQMSQLNQMFIDFLNTASTLSEDEHVDMEGSLVDMPGISNDAPNFQSQEDPRNPPPPPPPQDDDDGSQSKKKHHSSTFKRAAEAMTLVLLGLGIIALLCVIARSIKAMRERQAYEQWRKSFAPMLK